MLLVQLFAVVLLSPLVLRAQIDLTDGIRQTYEWFLQHHGEARM